MTTFSLSLPALTTEQVYNLAKYDLLTAVVTKLSGRHFWDPTHVIFEKAAKFAKENELVFETSRLKEYISVMVPEEYTKWSDENTIAEIKAYYAQA